MNNKKIKILKNGPYIVSGGVDISEKIIYPVGKGYELRDGQEIEKKEVYSLCRCGNSKNTPFCDNTHDDFEGCETASMEKFDTRAELIEGPGLDMLDDHRCALARFCHRDSGSAWELIKKTGDPYLREEAIRASVECPAGRLVIRDKDGNEIEPEYREEIEVLQDIEKKVSGPLSVKGNIEIESSYGESYEVRNRVTLCRCGKSENKPFCDGKHISEKFRDDIIDLGDEN